jgi:PST family polysaccharide transporter
MSSAFSLLNTLLIGIILTKQYVAYWTVAFQFLTAIQTMYNPIISCVYPMMLKEKKLKVIHQIMLIFMPIILVGSVAVFFLSDWFVNLVFGQSYFYSGTIIRWIIPVIVASFPALLYAWPCFSVINKEKINTIITMIGACVQVLGVVILVVTDMFTLINLAIIRSLVEVILAVARMIAVYRYRKQFIGANAEHLVVVEE